MSANVTRLVHMVSQRKVLVADAVSAALSDATTKLPAPLSVVDLNAFDANARHMATRTHGKPIRVATKSVRNRTLLDRVLAVPGYQGLMCYSLEEALWLLDHGYTDILVAYPTVNRIALTQLAQRREALAEIVLMVDSLEHFELLDSFAPVAPFQVALDCDASLEIFEKLKNPIHIGVWRSALRSPADVTALLHQTSAFKHVKVVGAMFYDAQIAGLPDNSMLLRAMKKLSRAELAERRREVIAELTQRCGPLRLVNAGGTGSIADYEQADEVTEVTAGSGLYNPALFDGYDGLGLAPSAYFGLDVVRRPSEKIFTAFAGGYVASGPAKKSRLPKPVSSRFILTANEGAGEVQTPLRVRSAADALNVGDRIWLRNSKAGEQMERFNETHLFDGAQIVETTLTYRGEGKNFG